MNINRSRMDLLGAVMKKRINFFFKERVKWDDIAFKIKSQCKNEEKIIAFRYGNININNQICIR